MKVRLLFFFIFFSACSLFAVSPVSYFVVTTKNALILANPMKNSTILYSTTKGNHFVVLESKKDYVRINVQNNILGWISSSTGKTIELTTPPSKASVSVYKKSNPVYKYTYLGQEDFRFPRRETNQFFDINVDGFYEIKASGRSVDPNDMSSPIWQTIINDPVYQKIPRSVLMGPIQLDYRSLINVEGKLSNDLHVFLDIEQETNMPHKMDVEVKYKEHFLDFFDYEASYNQGNFFKINKSVRGAQYQYSKDKDFFQLSTGKERSQAQSVEGFGTGAAMIKLAHKYIYPSSVYVYKNNKEQSENSDFFVDYYSGEVTFSTPLQTTDYYKIIYEFSNPIADFLPVLSRRNFLASQYTKKPRTITESELSVKNSTDMFVLSSNSFSPSYPTFNFTYVERFPSFNNDLFVTLRNSFVSYNLLTEDFYISPSFRPTQDISFVIQNTQFKSLGYWVKSSFDKLYNDNKLEKQSFDLSFSDVQVFPDSFILIDNISLQESVNLFYELIDNNILSSQGYIAQRLFSINSLLPNTSSFYEYGSDILLFLKSKLIEKNPSSRASYILKNTPILLGSDKIYINDVFIERNKDYFLDNRLGIVSFLLPLSSSDNIRMSYSYYEKKAYSEEFLGKNSIGPYLLAHNNIIKQSLQVLLNNQFLQETRDFIVDYEKGEIYFNFEVQYPDILSFNYNYIVKNLKESISETQPFEISTSFVQEYVSPDEESNVIKVSSENVTVSNNIITLSNSPLINTSNISISVSNSSISNSDYFVSNYYRSEITFTGISLADNTSVQVSYDYQKSHRTKFIFLADGRNTAYNVDGTEFIFRDIPIKYKSVASVTKFDGISEVRLEENIDYSVSFSDYGDYLSMTFYTKNESGNSAKLDTYPQSGDRISILYDFSPSSLAIEETVYHQMLGTSIKTNLDNNWEFDSELVVAKNNYGGKVFEGELQNLSGTGVLNDFYFLGQQNIVENSEQVFLNGISQTKDTDYIVIYKSGTLRFRDLTVMPEDKIDAFYKYETSSGIVSAGNDVSSYATRFRSSYDTPSVNFNASLKYIDKEFEPIGNINEPNGSTLVDTSFKWNSSNTFSIKSDYSHYKTFVRTNANNKDVFLKTNNFNTNFNKRFFNFFDTTNSFRYQNNIQDSELDSNNNSTRAQDSYLYSYNGNFKFGPENLFSEVGYGLSQQKFDYLDELAPRDTTTRLRTLKSNLSFSDLFILGNVNLNPNYYYSYSETTESIAPTFSFTERYNFDLGSSIKPLNSLLITPKVAFSKTTRQTSSITTENTNEAKSYSLASSFSPFSWISTGASYAHNESESPLLGQKSNLDQSRSASISRLSPYAGIRKIGFSKNHFLSKMFYPTNFSLYYSDNTKKTNNHNNIRNNDSTRYNINSIVLLPGFSVDGLSYSDSNSNQNNLINSSIVSENITVSNSEDYSGSLSLRPSIPILKYFQLSSSLRESTSDSTVSSQAFSVTGNETINSVFENNYDYKVSFNSPQFYIKNPFLRRRRIRLGRGTISYNFDFLKKRNSQNSYDIFYDNTSQIFDQVSTSNETLDNQDTTNQTVSFSVSPLNLITFSGNWSAEENYLNRNKFVSSSSIFQDKENLSGSTSFSPFSFLTFSISAEKSSYTQWLLPSINVSATDLQSTSNVQLSRINNHSEKYSVGSTFSPFRFFSLEGNVNQRLITEKNKPTLSSESVNSFSVFSLTAGASLYPLRDMTISYAYTLEDTDGSESTTNSVVFNYVPAKSANKKININFTYNNTKGTGLNILSQETSAQGTGEIIASEVVLRQNEVYYGSINVSYIYPINKIVVQNFTLDIEGYVKSINDQVVDTNNYTINGIIAKGVLNF